MNISRIFGTHALFLMLSLGFFGVWGQGGPTCPKTVGTELVTNGGFNSGNSGFTSGYTYSAAAVGPGQYTIGTNPNTSNTYFANIADHTPSADGNMLIMDVDATVGKNVYTTTVNVTAGRTYFFSAWFANINTNTSCATCSTVPPKYENAPQLRFSIEGVTVGNIVRVDSTDHAWTQFNTSWTALSTGPIEISIQNLRNQPNGNDLALDDISFKAGCDGITDLSALGKASRLVDTVFTCNENFAFDLKTQLTDSKYNFEWYNGTSKLAGNFTPAANQDDKFNTAHDVYSINPAPTNGTKYYVCYDSLGDGVTCPRLDSVLFLNTFEYDIPDRKICPPLSEVLDPSLTTTNITSWTYERISPAPVAVIASGTGFVTPQTVNKAGTYRLTIVHANGTCTSTPDLVKVDTIAASFNGAINASCSGGVATGTVTLVPNISGAQSVTKIGTDYNVSWFTTPTGTSPEYGPFKSATAVGTTASSNLVTTNPACPQGGLYLQDNNSYRTRVRLTEPACAISAVNGPGTGYEKIVVTAPLSISSLDVYVKSNNASTGENITVEALLYPEITNFNSIPAPITTIATRNFVGYTGNLKKETIVGTNYLIAPGTYHIRVRSFPTGNPTGNLDLGYYNCKGAAANYTDSTNIISVTGLNVYNNDRPNEHGAIFNLRAQIGNPASCGRVWVCAVCSTPVTYIYFNVYPTDDHQVLITWGTANETQNKKFVIEASADGVHFNAIGEKLGANNSSIQRDYSFVHMLESAGKHYYRIKQVDHDGKTSYTAVKFVSLNAADAVVSAYPQPIKQGETLKVEINGLSGIALTFKLADVSGTLVANGALDIAEGENTFGISTNNIKAGVYLLTLHNDDFVKTIRVVVE